MAPAFSTMINDLMQTPRSENLQKGQPITIPLANVIKSDDAYTVSLSLPGISKEQIDIIIDQNRLTVKSKTEQSEEQTFRLREFNYNNFQRVFTIPKHVDTEHISAKHEAGILTLSLPIVPDAKPKKIEIQ